MFKCKQGTTSTDRTGGGSYKEGPGRQKIQVLAKGYINDRNDPDDLQYVSSPINGGGTGGGEEAGPPVSGLVDEIDVSRMCVK